MDTVYKIGETYHIWTVTFSWWGKIVEITPYELVMENPDLVFATGDFETYFATNKSKRAVKKAEAVPGRVSIPRDKICAGVRR